MNAGSPNDAVHQLADQKSKADEPVHITERLQRHEYVQAMGHVRFASLVQRIEEAYHQVIPSLQF